MIKKVLKTIKENKIYILLMIAVIVVCSIFFIANVSGESMTNTYEDGEKVICTRIFNIERKDIVVCDPDEGRRLIKRVIAVGGDTIDIQGNKVYVNGKELSEPYIKEEMTYIPENSQTYPLTIPEGKIFVMGDNRNHSVDSRDTRCGLISEDKVLGEVIFNGSRIMKRMPHLR